MDVMPTLVEHGMLLALARAGATRGPVRPSRARRHRRGAHPVRAAPDNSYGVPPLGAGRGDARGVPVERGRGARPAPRLPARPELAAYGQPRPTVWEPGRVS